jgi:4-hydroxy-tetrahydrodipicolinate synthase
MARVRELNAKLVGLHRDLFCEANPIPVKWAVSRWA